MSGKLSVSRAVLADLRSRNPARALTELADVSQVCHPECVDRHVPCLATPLGQHLTLPRARIPETSSDFALLCACAHSDASFYEANLFKDGRTIGRWPAPAARGDCHRPSAVPDLVIDPTTTSTTTSGNVSRCASPDPSHCGRLTHCVPIARARQGPCTQARRRRAEVEKRLCNGMASGASSRATSSDGESGGMGPCRGRAEWAVYLAAAAKQRTESSGATATMNGAGNAPTTVRGLSRGTATRRVRGAATSVIGV